MRIQRYNQIALLFLFISFSAQSALGQLRTYQEITVSIPVLENDPHAFMRDHPSISSSMQTNDPNMQQMLKESVAQAPITWNVPDQWRELKSTGLRLASFESLDKNFVIDCSIVSLGGMAGGKESNIIRWAGQLGIDLSGERLKSFLSSSEVYKMDSGFSAEIFDFSSLQKDQDDKASMKAAIFDMQELTIFIKMTGTVKAIKHHTGSYDHLVTSVRVSE